MPSQMVTDGHGPLRTVALSLLPGELNNVSLDFGDLERHGCYVAHKAQAGITQHPMQGGGGATLGPGDQPGAAQPEAEAVPMDMS